MIRNLILSLVLMLLLVGNANGWFWEKEYLARVNGEKIESDDFQRRLDELHRQRSMQRREGKTSGIDLTKALDDMIDDYLMCQEGVRLGLDQEEDFKRKSNSFLEFQSILRLRKEEIKNKVEVTEGEIREYYEKHYQGAGKGEKPHHDLKKVEGKIRRAIYKTKEKEREKEYLNNLKKQAKIEIDTELIESLGRNRGDGEAVIARVNGRAVRERDLIRECGKSLVGKDEEEAGQIRKKALSSLLDYFLIKGDALDHNYSEKDPLFGTMIKQYRIILMASVFKRLVIASRVKISEDSMKEYYENNKDEFRGDTRVKLSIIKVADKDEAVSLWEELKAGANFNRLSRLNEQETMGKRRTRSAWLVLKRLSPQIKDAVEKIEVGEISNVIEFSHYFQIVKLVDREEGNLIEFSAVKSMIKKILGRKEYKLRLDEYLMKMRDCSSIRINKKLLNNFMKKVENVS